MPGFTDGPSFAPTEVPWASGWEWDQRIDDGHAHEWERCYLKASAVRAAQHVIRCRECRVPRCGNAGDDDPCMERRHHRGLHIHLSGRYRPLGDLLPTPDTVDEMGWED